MTKLERIIVTSKPVSYIIHLTKRFSLPGFQKLSIFDVSKFFFRQLSTTGIGQRASSIAYNLIIAIPAGFLFLFTIVPHLPKAIRVDFNNELFKLITAYFTPNPATEVWLKNSLNDFINIQRGGLSILGLLLVVWATSNAMIGIMNSFDHTIILKKQKNFFQNRWTAIKLTSLLVFIVIACVVLLIGESFLLKVLFKYVIVENETNRLIVKILDWLIIVFVSIISIGAIYKYAPSIHKRWKLITPGSILTTFLLLLTTVIFSYWVNHFSNYNKLYGSVGTVIILMLVIYFNSIVLLIGFELNNSITSIKNKIQS